MLMASIDRKIENPTHLFALKDFVKKFNSQEFDKIPDKEVYLYQIIIDNFSTPDFVIDNFIKNAPFERNLEICKGARVMLLTNLDVDNGLANGSVGIVDDFDEDDLPIVKFDVGIRITVPQWTWECEEDRKVKFTITQVPLKLSYAISIHKSQSLTLDKVEVDFTKIFEYGQIYTALSRVRTIEGLCIRNFDLKMCKPHPKAVEYYHSLDLGS